jgi:NADH:ubiquinone oxidoreductase subunit 3 (subunit A)
MMFLNNTVLWLNNSQIYFSVLIALSISFIIGLIFQTVGLVIAPVLINIDKQSSYECGFDPFGDARNLFDISFYKTSILFLLFDLELVYVTPLAAYAINWYQLFIFLIFVFLLLMGFFYEWFLAVLEWV